MESRLLVLLLLTVLTRTLPLLSANSDKYTRCGQMFQCGTIRNISYPFWGGSRPNYCGHSDPSFQLANCQKDEPPTMTINSFPYRVLAIDNQTHTLTLVRDDYWNNLCPDQPRNVTLDDAHFHPAPGTTDLMLYYDCQITGSSTGHPNQFSCPGRAQPSFYAWYGDELNDGVTCRTGVRVQVTTVGNTMPFNVARAVNAGFGLMWDASNTDCDRCAQRGEQCGSDPASRSFACFEKGSSVNRIRIAIPIVCGFVALVGIGLAVFGLRRQRKRAVTGQSSQSESKDDPPSSMSKGLMFTTTPSADLSQSIPSYESSTSNFGNSSSYFGVQVFSYSELEEATDNFNPSRELGEGGFGTVYYGKLRDNRAVAVKRLYENNFKRIEQFMNELDILTRLRHENLVTLYGCTSRRSRELLLVYEYISNGTVADHLHGNRPKPQPLSWPTRLKIAIETAGALAYLHKSDIIHRDVKTNNILLDNDFRVKVADFGLSRLFPTDVTHVSTAPQGTPGYVDPEYHQCYQLTEKSDVYSFGVVLIELISSKQAVDTSRERLDINLANMAINRIQNQALNELVDLSLGFETDTSVRRMTTSVAELAFRCLQTERDMRPSMADVLKALRGIKDGKLSLQQAEVLEIVVEDDVALLRGKSTPVSPRSPSPVDV